jgi:hypothetical protein
MSACSRLPIERSGSGNLAIAPSTAFSCSALFAATFSSFARSLIAARSSGVNPFDALPVVLLLVFRVAFFEGLFSAIAKHPPLLR